MSYNESLRSDSNYPPMSQSDWDNAPWNLSEPNEEKFNVCISQTLSKSTSVTTNDYIPMTDENEDGIWPYNDTSDTNWKKAYSEEHMTPLELIAKFKRLLIDTKEGKGEGLLLGCDPNHKSLDYLIDECSNWVEDDFEVIEE